MPSASAKLEKFASTEAADPIKQVILMIDKKVRNLEKRKGKLDNYRTDFQNGKELNEDQKNAIKKYDHVVEVVEFAKEFQKSVNSTIQDCLKLQKKLAKREQVEKQQQEIHKVYEILLFKDLLLYLSNEKNHQNFLDGTGGAVQLNEKELSLLDELIKLLLPEQIRKGKQYEEQLLEASEHLVALAESKKKDFLGMTYQSVKELLLKIHSCDYFSSTQLPKEEKVENDEVEAEEEIKDEESPEKEMREVEVASVEESQASEIELPERVQVEDTNGELSQPDPSTSIQASSDYEDQPQPEHSEQEHDNQPSEIVPAENVPFSKTTDVAITTQTILPKHPLQDVLPLQGHFSFLQESQIDMESPHMDPAVVVAHPMVPVSSSGHQSSQYNVQISQQDTAQKSSEKTEEKSTIPDTTTDTPSEQLVSMPSVSVSAITQPVLTHSSHQDFDPSQPIPTQTFTNQNFTVMQNMIAAPAYIPVTMHHGPIPTHVTPVALVPQQISPRATPPPTTAGLPIHLAAVPVSASTLPVSASILPPTSLASQESKDHYVGSEYQVSLPNGDASHPEAEVSHHSLNTEQPLNHTDESQGNYAYQQNIAYNQSRNNYMNGRNRNRGRNSNGYSRGRGYSNGRGGYQGYYQGYGGTQHSGNGYKRGGARGGPYSGGGNGRGGRGGYRPQQAVH